MRNIGNIKVLSVKGESEEQHLVRKGGDLELNSREIVFKTAIWDLLYTTLNNKTNRKLVMVTINHSQQQTAPQRQLDQSKITNGENQSSSQ